MDYDVIIVGGGPAGSAAAITLAREGLSVAVVDSSAFPRDKACGDGILPGATRILRQLGLGPALRRQNFTSIRRIRVCSPGGRSLSVIITPPREEPFLIAPRHTLDDQLHREALSRGACGIQARVVDLRREPGRPIQIRLRTPAAEQWLRCRFVVAADGSASVVRRACTGETPPVHSVAIRAYVTPTSFPIDTAEFDFRPDQFPGYAWIFPVSRGCVNVGLGMDRNQLLASGLSLRQHLDRYLRTLRRRSWAADGAKAYRPRAGFYWFLAERPAAVAFPGIFLTGDAAGLMDPLSGEGIRNALLSGVLAADTIATGVRRGIPASRLAREYTRRLHTEILPVLQRSLRLRKRALASPRHFHTLITLGRSAYPFLRLWANHFSTNFTFG